LNSPSTKSCKICLSRRTVQSCVEFWAFPLEESGFVRSVNYILTTAAYVIASSTRWAMKKAAVLSILVVAVLLPVGVKAQAQQPGKPPRIGLLYASASINAVRIAAFRQGMRELGYVEGKNFVLEERYAEGKLDRFPASGRAGAS
jgi:hypothetical protein